MKEMNEIKSKIREIRENMKSLNDEALKEKRDFTPEEQSKYDILKEELIKNEKILERMLEAEELNKRMAMEDIKNEKREESLTNRWLDAFIDYATKGIISEEFRGYNGGILVPKELRADPILTTTNTGIINKTIGPVSVKTPSGLEWLRSIGVTFDEGLTGNYVLPSVATVSVGFVGEGNDTSTANVTPASVTLAARTVGGNQTISRQTLAQTNPEILASVLDVIDRAIGTEIVKDCFVQAEADATGRKATMNASSATYNTILNIDSSINVELQRPVIVMSKKTANYFKVLNVGSAGIRFAIENGEMNGYPVYTHPSLPDNKIWLFDATDMHVGFWGNKELIIDQYSSKKSGKIEFQVLQLCDTGYANPASIVIADVSAGI